MTMQASFRRRAKISLNAAAITRDEEKASSSGRRKEDHDSQSKQKVSRNDASNSRPRALFCVLALVIAASVLGSYVHDRMTATGRWLTTTSDQPLVTRSDDFLSDEAFESLRKCALEHPKLHVAGELNGETFGKTRGFVLKFNEDGLERFRSKKEYACFVDVFDRLRAPLTNAFVMNVLLCELQDYSAYDANGMAVGLHLDDTVGIFSKHEFVAHQVSVLYVSVPEDMEGGQLELFPYGNGATPENVEPTEAVEPKENLMATFRGDAFHRVRAYRTRSKRERVSLVLEQYHIGDNHYPKTITFSESLKSNMTMDV